MIESQITDKTEEKIKKRLEKVVSMLNDDRIKEIQSAVDEDAKQGYKSEDNDFFGYKNHVAMTPERIVTALEITSGKAPDGKYSQSLVDKSKKAGILKRIIRKMDVVYQYKTGTLHPNFLYFRKIFLKSKR